MGIDFTVGFGLSMIMAYISYTYFEAPFLKLKNKFAYFTK
jgi:peptidoglycan/LPS O-acetylase OafA/YrhL